MSREILFKPRGCEYVAHDEAVGFKHQVALAQALDGYLTGRQRASGLCFADSCVATVRVWVFVQRISR